MSVPPEIIDAARRWMRWALEDHALARFAVTNVELAPRGACMWSHQAGEKAIKALLVAYDIDPPKQHDLDRLTLRLPEPARRLFVDIDLGSLSRWAIDGRYPDDFEEATIAQAAAAIEHAQQVLALAASHLDRMFDRPST